MIVVLDTNVVISSLLASTSKPAEIFGFWEAERFDVAISPHLLDELRRAIQYLQVAKYLKMSDDALNEFLRRYAMFAIYVEPQIKLEIIKDDPDDNRVLECAVTGNASFIITGDKHLLNLKEFRGIVILPPSGFLTLLGSK